MNSKPWFLYIIHFKEKYKHAQHYVGIAQNVEDRFAEHMAGRGARLLQVVREAGIKIEACSTIKEFSDFSSAHLAEKKLKATNNTKRYCPICKKKETELLTVGSEEHAHTL